MVRSHRRPPRRGVAAVEFAIVVPLIVILLLGTWEVGRMLGVSNTLDNAVREGGRRASSGYFNLAQCEQVVTEYVKAAGIPVTNLTVTVENLTQPGVDPMNAAQMDEFRVRASMPFNDVQWVAIDLVTNASTRLTAESRWFSVRDKDYPTLPEPPIE